MPLLRSISIGKPSRLPPSTIRATAFGRAAFPPPGKPSKPSPANIWAPITKSLWKPPSTPGPLSPSFSLTPARSWFPIH